MRFIKEIDDFTKSLIEDANKCKRKFVNFASMYDRKNKKYYYILTEEQLKLILRKAKIVPKSEESRT